ncbi:ABC-2 type transport system permease protein [Pseudobutyrivibrio sp. ACV-2]|uniref:ABC transporter permease n=1 Tax=Pseudobutyrivibrio sp. ACV-2 TaxID=1520801 RepID=UPI000898D22D|nr:ABC transporter permease [Pseudobutyrivibrio sp. ACV-2]SEB00565.1 ABC-2 type transport system permease protein [Pseudobutyrivibrio sp. ACV-2]
MNHLKEIFEYREMIYGLVRRELRGRYKGSVLGFLWTFINPLLQLVVYTLVFSVIMRAGIDKYYLFLFVALVPWIFFSTCLTGGAGCIMASQDMVKKIYFPREVIPIAFATSAFINMLLTFVVVFVVLLFSGYGLNPVALLYLPIVMLVEFFLALGITLLASACTVYFRDLQYILGIISMAWQYLTPVLYSSAMVEEQLANHRILLYIWNLNPTTPLINAYRQILYYKSVPDLHTLLAAVILGMLVCVIGYLTFQKLQRGFAEEL